MTQPNTFALGESPMTKPLVYTQRIYLADNEWSSHEEYKLMERVARDAILSNPGRTVVVTVHEHGGWWLQYAMLRSPITQVENLTIVGSDNDRALYPPEVQDFWKYLRTCDIEVLPQIRRQSVPTPPPSGPVHVEDQRKKFGETDAEYAVRTRGL